MKLNLLTCVLFLVLFGGQIIVVRPGFGTNPAYYSVEPIAIVPLANINESVNGLETAASPSPTGLFFNVEIHLREATLANVPVGVLGVRVHFDFSQILEYCQAVGFTDDLGTANGVLTGPQSSLLRGIAAGLYLPDGKTQTSSPYTGATQYIVEANSTNGPWNATDGIVAVIEFEIKSQPTTDVGDFFGSMPITYSSVVDGNANSVNVGTVPGTLHLEAVNFGPDALSYSITPESFTGSATMGALFNYSVMMTSAASWDLAGYDMSATWNNTLMNLVNVFEGGFLQQGGAITGGQFNQTPGNVEVNFTKLSDPVPSRGTDSLFTLEFNVTYVATTYPTPNCTIMVIPRSILSWPHPERSFPPWNGSDNMVNLLPNLLLIGRWSTENALYTAAGLPWHHVSINNVELSKTIVGAGEPINIAITSIDDGNFTESFNVTADANNTVISTKQVNLSATNRTTSTFTWNTSGFAYGNYTVGAYDSPVPGQTDTSNNKATVGVVRVTIPGDVNGDFKVTLADLVLLANSYGSRPGDPKWNPNADINGEGVIGLTDLVTLATHYGQHYP